MDKTKIFSKLLVDEDLNEREFEEIAGLASKFIEIQKTTGDVYIKNIDSYTIPKKLELLLVGLWVSQELGLLDESKVTCAYLSERLGEKQTSVSGPLSILLKNNIVKKKDQSYVLNAFKIKSVLTNFENDDKGVLVIKKPAKIHATNKRKKTKHSVKNITKVKPSEVSYDRLDDNLIQNELHKYGLNCVDIEHLFNIDEKKNLFMLKKPSGENNKEIHLKGTLLFLTGYKLYFNLDEIDSSILKRQLENTGITGLTNLSTNIKGFSECIIHKRGEKGNIFTKYKLTNYGYNYGIKLIKDSINKTDEFDLFDKSNTVGKRRTSRKAVSNFIINIDEKQLQESIDYFCKTNEIEKSKLLSNFELRNDNVRILFKIDKSARKHKQVNTLLYIGTILKEIYKISRFDCEFLLKRSHQPYERLDLLPRNPTFKKCFSVNNNMKGMELNYNGVEKGKIMVIEVCK